LCGVGEILNLNAVWGMLCIPIIHSWKLDSIHSWDFGNVHSWDFVSIHSWNRRVD
jgi:hypothetical protein